MIRLADLCGKRVVGADGANFGVVHEVRAKGGLIDALDCGPGGFLERMNGKVGGRRIPWKAVRAIKAKEIIVDLGE